MKLTSICVSMAILATTSMALGGRITYSTPTKVAPCYNADGSAIISPSQNIWVVTLYATPDEGDTSMISWGSHITSTVITPGASIFHLAAFGDLQINKEADANGYDAPSHPNVTTRKNDGYAKAGDTWLGAAWGLIVQPDFTQPDENGNMPNQWDLHIGTGGGSGYNEVAIGQWAIDLGSNSSATLQVSGTISRHGLDYGVLGTQGTYVYETMNILVPEPATMSLLGLSTLAILKRRRR